MSESLAFEIRFEGGAQAFARDRLHVEHPSDEKGTEPDQHEHVDRRTA
jgi:hypothetical protein